MSKIKEKNIRAKLRSAEEAKDREFEQWVQQQFMAEAAAIEKEIDEIPDSEEFEPTEEKFSDSAQTKVSEDRTKEKNGIITSEKIINEKLNNEKLNKEPNVTDHTRSRRKFAGMGEKVIKWAAVAAVTVFGIFGVSMTSEANRAYVMETVNNMTGNSTETEVDNNDMLRSGTTEQEARAEIEDNLGIELPQFYYLPDGMEYSEYVIYKESQVAFLQYIYENKVIRLMALTNEKNATSMINRDSGKELESITSNLAKDIKSTIWEIYESGDIEPTYVLQWDYKNSYYELAGKIPVEEIRQIAKEIMY